MNRGGAPENRDLKPITERKGMPATPTETRPTTETPANKFRTQNKKKDLSKYFDPDKGAMYFNCKERGHIGSNCPKKVCVMAPIQPRDYIIGGSIDGVYRDQVKLDSAAQRTLVNAAIVSDDAYFGESVRLTVADGHELDLPLAKVQFQFGNDKLVGEVAVLEGLEDDVLLGTDLPVLNELLRQATTHRAQAVKVHAVKTRKQVHEMKRQGEEDKLATATSGASTRPLSDVFDFNDDVYVETNIRPRHTKRQRRAEARRIAHERLDRRRTNIEMQKLKTSAYCSGKTQR